MTPRERALAISRETSRLEAEALRALPESRTVLSPAFENLQRAITGILTREERREGNKE